MSSRHLSKRIGKLKAKSQRRDHERLKARKMHLEALEDRRVMATGPTLIALIPNTGVPLNFTNNDVLDVAPRELLFRFSEGQVIDAASVQQGIRITRSGRDGIFGNPNDVAITPGFVGIGERTREVILRFAETLPDDAYQITVVGAGPTPLRDSAGNPFNGGANQVIPFRLDLGAQIVAVVPQPITFTAASGPNRLAQDKSQIVVHFNADQLSEASAENPAFYRLINSTSGTVRTPEGKPGIDPVRYTYDPIAQRGTAILQFNSDIGDGFYELRIGTNGDNESSVVTVVSAGSDLNSTYNTATDVGALGLGSYVINSDLGTRPYNVPWPGAMDDPGHRDMAAGPTGEQHLLGGDNPGDGFPSASVQTYNFGDIYGFDPISGAPLHNLITENQKQRTREIFELYSYYSGITFRETFGSGFLIATGDTRAIAPNIDPLGLGGITNGTVAVLNSLINWGESEYGGSWFQTAMHEIGHMLGLDHSYDLPPLGIQGRANVPQNSATPAEPVFPGDGDILHVQTIFRPDSRDIDLYKFNVNQAGNFTAEITAERNDSNLNATLWLYREVVPDSGPMFRELIARNDDYYGEDSFLDLNLEPGTYYVAVMSSGMTDVDPNLTDSGIGGRSAGTYSLNLKHTPPAGQAIVDLTGKTLDGDADGVPGGTFSFWFQSGQTIFVDRANDTTSGIDGNGTLLNPYDTISAALAAADASATPVIVRIVGNGGVDGQLGTGNDARPYLIGINDGGIPLRDGRDFRVPNDTTVMIDAGAVIKLQQANLDAGSTSTNVDRGRGAIQVLGTPVVPVWLTAYSNDGLGGDSDGVSDGPHRGDWGGIVYRNDSDREANGIFLNYVNQANITFGGGRVVVDSVEDVYNPVHMLEARPTVSFNTIERSADAALSANPNSFDDSLGRIGPDIHGNVIFNNTLNGLLIRTRATSGNNALSIQTVQGRWDDIDVTHILGDNLILQGQPGGRSSLGGGANKMDARLKIDPGIVLKLEGARIEAGFGAQLLAEGTPQLPIVFTSLRDDRFGGADIFDTNNDLGATVGQPGHWGGLMFNATSSGSVDWAKLYFGGGSVPIEGAFDFFNVVEIHQADVRVANSLFQSNESGQSATNRNGRGFNADATIFVRGAQPVIANNVFKDNEGNVISINANALQARVQGDWGRSTGLLGTNFGLFQRTDRLEDNHGPLIRFNRTGNNTTNGMEVRGGTLTTETVWDDIDIVHVLRDEIVVLNHHVYSGIRLQSAPSASLVVKLDGDSAGFTANGVPLDIDDRIGGSVQVLGQPGFDVILTSLHDCTSGAGFNTDGQLQTDTDNTGTCGGTVIVTTPYVDVIVLMDETVTMGPIQAFSVQFIADLEAALLARGIGATPAGGNRYGLFGFGSIANEQGHVIPVGAGGAPFGTSTEYAIAAQQLVTNGAIEDTYLAMDLMFPNYVTRTDAAKFVILASDEDRDITDPAQTFGTTLAQLQNGGFNYHGIVSVDIDDANGNQAIALDAQNRAYVDNGAGGYSVTPNGVFTGSFGTTIPDHADMVFARNGIVGDIESIANDPPTATIFSKILADTIIAQVDVSGAQPGDWRSVRLDKYSNDRNVGIAVEREAAYANIEATLNNGVSDSNRTPNVAQFLGSMSTQDKSGDENRRLGFEIHGVIQHDNPRDVDVYSFNADAGTEIWIDIDRTSHALDTMVELIDANGNVLARAQNDVALSGLAQHFNKNTYNGRDTFSTNPLDPIMRLTLPAGPGGSTNVPYFVRVRSEAPIGGNIDDINAGATKGQYQLQIRLQQQDEKPGSTIRLADIRYATNGIEVLGLPRHSPLLSESGEANVVNDAFGNAQQLGNLLRSDRNVFSVAGGLSGLGDVDFFQFELNYDLIQVIGGFSDGFKTFATMFDIDYANGLTRADINLALFDDQGRLIFVGRDSNIADDQPAPGQGADTDDLSRGSFGTLDPYLGSVQLPAGNTPANVSRTYYVAVSSNRRLPEALNATFQANATSPLIRLEPVNSVRRIVEDHIGFSGGGTSLPPDTTLIDSPSLTTNVRPFDLSDVNLFVSTGAGDNGLYVVDPKTGTQEFRVGGLPQNIGDIVFRSDVHLFASQGIPGQNNDVGNLLELNFETAGATVIGDDDIPNFDPATNPPDPFQLTSDVIDAIAISGNAVNNNYRVFISARAGGGGSKLYEINPTTGDLIRSNTGLIVSGGVTTGMAFVDGTLFGVNDNGDLYRIGLGGGVFPIATIPGNPSFAGLARGPINVENQAYRDLLFAVTSGGRLYCFNTSGVLQTVFDTNDDGVADATNISTGLGGATGLAFSPIDESLWHTTTRRENDAGHGINTAPDNSRMEPADGDRSVWFGFEGAGQRGFDNHANNRDLATNPAVVNSYNVPGGTYGVLTTNPFSLAGSTRGDKPTLYYNYFLATEGVQGSISNRLMRDAARVHISTNGGATWDLLTTNNSQRDLPEGPREGELPPFSSDTITDHPDNQFQLVQEEFDNTAFWRQARVDLSDYAGRTNLLLRFTFTTSGAINGIRGLSLPEDVYGNHNSNLRGRNNSFEGFYFDDIIIGYAERGEMVTNASSNVAGFFAVPPPVSETADPPPVEVLTGPYQLEIRRGIEYGVNENGFEPDINLYRTFDTNTRLIPSLLPVDHPNNRRDGRGDSNFVRQQGHIQIEQNFVTNVEGIGILIDNAPRDGSGSQPYPGAVRNLPTLNNERLYPGVVVTNNVVANFATAGIRYSGDDNPFGLTVAATPFGRIVNNTIVGGIAGAVGIGIQVNENASPTILNNIVANTATGIAIDAATGATAVVGTNLFSGNGSNGTTGNNAIILAPGEPLFVNPGRRNFYLADNSRAIDSSLNSLPDRPSITAVKSPLGIGPSPILAPDRDALGQLRVDDPTQDPPPGLGSNIFKDRGAIERADFVGPIAEMLVPADNDAEGLDQDSRDTFIIFDSQFLDRFVVKLLDTGGVGIDDLLVTGSRVQLTQNGVPLVQGLDYTFVYDAGSDEILLLPAAGVWGYRKTYVITIDNSAATGLTDLAGNLLQANQTDGTTRFTIFVGAPIDFGDAPDPTYPTLEVNNGAGHKFIPGIHLGTGVTPDIVPLPTPNADGDTLDDGLISNSFRLNSSSGQMVVSASVAGKLDAWLDLNQDGDWNDVGENIVSSATPAGQLVAGNNTINLTLPDGGRGASFLRLRFSTAGINSPTGLADDGEVEDHRVLLLGPPFQNPIIALDVNNDGRITPVDALLVLNALNRFAASGLPGPFTLPYPGFMDAAPPFLDVDGNNLCTAVDALRVINFLNANAGPQGEGEADTSDTSTSAVSAPSSGGSIVPSVLYASSSVLLETKSAGAQTLSRSKVDDLLFAPENIEFREPTVSSISAYSVKIEDDLESNREGSWDEAIEEFDFDAGVK